jgi:hypothetical protein
MSIIKTIKFDLPIDGVKVKNIDELRDHFTVEIIELYKNGLLAKWLRSHNYKDELEKVSALANSFFTNVVSNDNFLESIDTVNIYEVDNVELMKKLCEIFTIESDDIVLSLALGIPLPTEHENFKKIQNQYIESLLEKESKILVDKIDYAVYYAIRLIALYGSYSYNKELFKDKNKFFKKGDSIDGVKITATGILKNQLWVGKINELGYYDSVSWYLCSEYLKHYDGNSDSYRNAFFFKAMQVQRKEILFALAQSVSIPILKKLLLERCDDLESIIKILPNGREEIKDSKKMAELPDYQKRLIFWGEGNIATDLNKAVKSDFNI